jgi:hypothetical protein
MAIQDAVQRDELALIERKKKAKAAAKPAAHGKTSNAISR